MSVQRDEQLVSVVIPTRDRPALVERALLSVLSQTYERLEVVVVDDGSTPPLTLPPSIRADPRVRTVRCEPPCGPGAARNTGVLECHGALLAFLDDDDTWRPTKIERQVQVLADAAGRADGVECGFDLWEEGRLVGRYLPQEDRDLSRTLVERPCLQPSTVLIRTAAFVEVGGFDPSLRRVEDWELWVRFCDAHHVAELREVLVDRAVSSPTDELRWYREMVRLLEPRIAALPSGERSRVRSVHHLVESHLLARDGARKAARSKALQALSEYPRCWARALLYVLRSVTGERVWSAGRGALRRGVYPLLRFVGRDPRVGG